MLFILNFDQAVWIVPKVEVLPSNKEAKFGLPLTIRFGCVLRGETIQVGSITVGG